MFFFLILTRYCQPICIWVQSMVARCLPMTQHICFSIRVQVRITVMIFHRDHIIQCNYRWKRVKTRQSVSVACDLIELEYLKRWERTVRVPTCTNQLIHKPFKSLLKLIPVMCASIWMLWRIPCNAFLYREQKNQVVVVRARLWIAHLNKKK
jgi:hypothetical protein